MNNSRTQKGILRINGGVFAVYKGVNTIGRNRSAVVNIKNLIVSQNQGLIIIHNDQHLICDLNSSNGTILNNLKLTPFTLHELTENSQITFGTLQGTYHFSTSGVSLDGTQSTQSDTGSLSQFLYGASTQLFEDTASQNETSEVATQVINWADSIPKKTQLNNLSQTITNNFNQPSNLHLPGPSTLFTAEINTVEDGELIEIIDDVTSNVLDQDVNRKQEVAVDDDDQATQIVSAELPETFNNEAPATRTVTELEDFEKAENQDKAIQMTNEVLATDRENADATSNSRMDVDDLFENERLEEQKEDSQEKTSVNSNVNSENAHVDINSNGRMDVEDLIEKDKQEEQKVNSQQKESVIGNGNSNLPSTSANNDDEDLTDCDEDITYISNKKHIQAEEEDDATDCEDDNKNMQSQKETLKGVEHDANESMDFLRISESSSPCSPTEVTKQDAACGEMDNSIEEDVIFKRSRKSFGVLSTQDLEDNDSESPSIVEDSFLGALTNNDQLEKSIPATQNMTRGDFNESDLIPATQCNEMESEPQFSSGSFKLGLTQYMKMSQSSTNAGPSTSGLTNISTQLRIDNDDDVYLASTQQVGVSEIAIKTTENESLFFAPTQKLNLKEGVEEIFDAATARDDDDKSDSIDLELDMANPQQLIVEPRVEEEQPDLLNPNASPEYDRVFLSSTQKSDTQTQIPAEIDAAKASSPVVDDDTLSLAAAVESSDNTEDLLGFEHKPSECKASANVLDNHRLFAASAKITPHSLVSDPGDVATQKAEIADVKTNIAKDNDDDDDVFMAATQRPNDNSEDLLGLDKDWRNRKIPVKERVNVNAGNGNYLKASTSKFLTSAVPRTCDLPTQTVEFVPKENQEGSCESEVADVRTNYLEDSGNDDDVFMAATQRPSDKTEDSLGLDKGRQNGKCSVTERVNQNSDDGNYFKASTTKFLTSANLHTCDLSTQTIDLVPKENQEGSREFFMAATRQHTKQSEELLITEDSSSLVPKPFKKLKGSSKTLATKPQRASTRRTRTTDRLLEQSGHDQATSISILSMEGRSDEKGQYEVRSLRRGKKKLNNKTSSLTFVEGQSSKGSPVSSNIKLELDDEFQTSRQKMSSSSVSDFHEIPTQKSEIAAPLLIEPVRDVSLPEVNSRRLKSEGSGDLTKRLTRAGNPKKTPADKVQEVTTLCTDQLPLEENNQSASVSDSLAKTKVTKITSEKGKKKFSFKKTTCNLNASLSFLRNDNEPPIKHEEYDSKTPVSAAETSSREAGKAIRSRTRVKTDVVVEAHKQVVPKPLKRGKRKTSAEEDRNPTPPKKQKKLEHQVSTIDSPRGLRKQKPKVAFTMMDNPLVESLIRQLGGSVVDSIEACSVLVTEHVKRTQKLLSAIGRAKPICSPKWVLDSKKAREFLDPWKYILIDTDSERKWDFTLTESLERSKAAKLFNNFSFLLQVSVGVDVLKGAIESCGGKCLARMPAAPSPDTYIVTTPENCAKYSKVTKKHPHVKVMEPEAVFDAALRQELRFAKYYL